MCLQSIQENLSKSFNEIKEIAYEKPIQGIINSVALKIIAVNISFFSNFIGFCFFSVSLIFDFFLFDNIRQKYCDFIFEYITVPAANYIDRIIHPHR